MTDPITLKLFLLLLLIPMTTSSLMWSGLHRVGAFSRFEISFSGILVASGIGGIIGFSLTDPVSSDTDRAIMSLVGASLLCMAWIDRISAWAPTEPLVLLMISVFLAGQYDFGVIPSFVLGLLVILGSHVLWEIQTRLGKPIISPADITALGVPLVLLGVSYWSVGVYVVTSVAMLAALRNSKVAAIFSHREAVLDGAEDTGMKGGSITFLSVIFPSTLLMVILWVIFGKEAVF